MLGLEDKYRRMMKTSSGGGRRDVVVIMQGGGKGNYTLILGYTFPQEDGG